MRRRGPRRTPRIAVVAGPDLGHLLPALGVGVGLREAGADVLVATGANRLGMVAAHGLEGIELPLLAPTPGDVDLAHVFWRRPVEMAPPLQAQLGPWAPDVVVADALTRVGGFVAEALRVPWVELHPTHLMEQDPLVPPVGLGRRPSRLPWRVVDDRFVRRRHAVSVAEGHRQRDAARRALDLPGAGGPSRRLLATLPGLEHPRARWPEDVHLVGAVHVDPPWAPLDPPEGDAPLVLVTDTTASGWDTGLGERTVAALAGSGLRVVVTSGELGPRRDRDVVVGRGPHGPLLAEAAVAVAPGGAGFVARALAAGVPLVVLHGPNDQREVAARVAWSGAGIALPPRRTGERRLARAVEAVVGETRYRAAAAAVAAGAAELGRARAADLVLDLVPRS